ncbi:formate dehydrogenase accessory sulfurtransferase FdhD [Deinococcus sp. Marseille-Q6407]|uniref:formate dehydrogenase accessory sulfurtransferase FdhD n=1 Tax=Deinococcus sp. Marseille-Q6407 TaxID=2969223 RepID=UPI0021BE043F|nr:formate dehydrogenase accessory sulfurtransferase FdhD [Deinococcus sp. Marseille-Q6407]
MRRYGPAGLDPIPADDLLAAEEPLELRLLTAGQAGEEERPLVVLMRTPGADRELLRGWLHAEGLSGQLQPHPENPNLWYLRGEVPPDYVARQTSSACGICGSGSVERLLLRTGALPARPPLDPALLAALPERLRAGQSGFAASGGLHGAALFSPDGRLLCLFEDIGRHNAADKVVGWALDRPELDRPGSVLVISSRLGYEIAQKAVLAGIGAVIGVGGATTLAAQTAQAFGLLLAGFARGGHLTVYTGAERLLGEGAHEH